MKPTLNRPIAFSLCLFLLLSLLSAIPRATLAAEEPVVQGDASRLTVSKTVYEEGEPILVSAIGSGTDWIGIYRVGIPHSVRWTYVDASRNGPGSGVEVNLRTVSGQNSGEPLDLPAGEYIIRLMPNDSTNINEAIAWIPVTITRAIPADETISPPLSAIYSLDSPTDGFAAGSITVKVSAQDTANRCIVMYWGDENGRLEGYTALPRCKVKGTTVTFTLDQGIMIPSGATRLLVYTMSDLSGKLSDSCVSVELPEGAAHAPLESTEHELFVMSDIHITLDQNHVHNKNFLNMLKDVASLRKDAMGIFVVGDSADTGMEQEYKNLLELYRSAGQVPPLFLAVGNHDLSGLPFAQANELFLKYATLPDGSHPTDTCYDFWLDGYHFIFLGTDQPAGLHASFDRSTMTWLEEKIKENRDPQRPVFLFLHQSLLNTVSGSLPGEGWSGVDNEKMLRTVLKDYPEVLFFNGHSHWTMDSVSNMFPGDSTLPCHIFNCASVAYLWSGYHVVTGEHLDGSQGYMVKLYEDHLYVLGRDFATGEWISAAQYAITLKAAPDEQETEIPETESFEATSESESPTSEAPSSEPDTSVPDTVVSEEISSEAVTKASSSVEEKGCNSLLSSMLLLCLIPAALLFKSNRKD